MATKCDIQLSWWLGLANLHKRELAHVTDLHSASNGFAAKVKELEGPRPEAVDILLGGKEVFHRSLVLVGNEPDKATWGLAGVTNAVLSELVSVRDAGKLPQEVVIADWSGFVAPLELSIAASAIIERAERFEPLAKLLDLLRGKTVARIGSCPVCGMLFERLRRDQACDTPRCRDVHRQRRNRQMQRQKQARKKPVS